MDGPTPEGCQHDPGHDPEHDSGHDLEHGDSLMFIGTATTVLRLGAFTVLTDPNFLHQGQRAYLGKGLWSRRLTEPAMQPDALPQLDAIVLSHLHGDHFDRVARRGLARSQPVLTTPHAARRLERWGFTCQGLAPWHSTEITKGDQSLVVRALPAVHARGVMGALLPPVTGSLIEHRAPGRPVLRVYVSGDTLTGEHVSAIAEQHPAIDVAVVHLGGTRVLLHTVTMDAAQGVDFLSRVRPRVAVPVHHDDYRVFRSPLTAFVRAAEAARLPTRVQTVARGETVELPRHP